jgi:hypothetical protein
MTFKKFITYPLFLIAGVILGAILLFLANIINFTHTNFAPMGGESWALWANPLALSLGLYFSARLFKLRQAKPILIVSLIVTFIFFGLIFEGNLLDNPLPFGVGS